MDNNTKMQELLSEHKIDTAAEVEEYWNKMVEEDYTDRDFFKEMSKENVQQMTSWLRAHTR